jgi:PAS domain-containing protein
MILAGDRQEIVEAARLARQGLAFDRSFRVTRSDGRIRVLRDRGEVVHNSGDNRSLVVGVMIDVSHVVEEENIREYAEDRFQTLIGASEGSVWIMRPDGWVLEQYPLSTQSDALCLALRWRDLVHPDDLSNFTGLITRAAATGAPHSMEYRLRNRAGTYRWKRTTISPIQNGNGQIRELLGVTLDIQGERVIPESPPEGADGLLTGAQIRAARGLVKWSVQDLADASGLSPATIRRFESVDGFFRSDRTDQQNILDTLTAAGAKFFFHHGTKPMVGPR